MLNIPKIKNKINGKATEVIAEIIITTCFRDNLELEGFLGGILVA